MNLKNYSSFESSIDKISLTKNPLEEIHICIATFDFVGFVKNDGIGTFFYHTACVLRDAGARVTIFYANRDTRFTLSDIKRITEDLRVNKFFVEFMIDVGDDQNISDNVLSE